MFTTQESELKVLHINVYNHSDRGRSVVTSEGGYWLHILFSRMEGYHAIYT